MKSPRFYDFHHVLQNSKVASIRNQSHHCPCRKPSRIPEKNGILMSLMPSTPGVFTKVYRRNYASSAHVALPDDVTGELWRSFFQSGAVISIWHTRRRRSVLLNTRDLQVRSRSNRALVPVLVIQHLHSHLATLGSRATGFREEPLESADSRFGTPIPKMTFVLQDKARCRYSLVSL